MSHITQKENFFVIAPSRKDWADAFQSKQKRKKGEPLLMGEEIVSAFDLDEWECLQNLSCVNRPNDR